MRKFFILYFTSLKNSFASRMAYRTDFFFSIGMIFVSELLLPLTTLFIYKTGASFPGWSIEEVLLLQGIFLLSRGCANLLFFGIVWNTLDRVREGTYDLLLIKPRSTLFISISAGFEPDCIGVVLSGLLVTIYALTKLPVIGLENIISFLLLFIISLIVLFSFALIMSGSVFKWVGNSRIFEIFDSISSFGNYPRSIFSKAFQTVISYIIPVTAVGFMPVSVLLGKEQDGVLFTCLISALFLLISLSFWKWMLSKYTSAGG